MASAIPIQAEVEKSWNSTCRLLFGKEMGRLADYSGWLSSSVPKLSHAKSGLTGKDVTYAITDYCAGSKRASLDELEKLQKFSPLNINQMKDMDSLIEAVQERAYYTGNVILGNCGFIEGSSNCLDSYFVLNSGMVTDCKGIGYCGRIKECEKAFGCDGISESQFVIRIFEAWKCSRSLEVWKSQSCTDCYYVNGLANCSNCMFCFNVRNKRNAIGNLELSPDKYARIKAKLVSEMADELAGSKSLPSLVDIVGRCEGELKAPLFSQLKKIEKVEKPNLEKVESAFGKTTALIFGKQLSGIDSYSGWLRGHVLEMELVNSIISGKPMLLADYSNYLLYPRKRIVTVLEAEHIGANASIAKEDADSLSFHTIHEAIAPIAYLSPELTVGQNDNVIECATTYISMNSYRSPGVSFSKNTAYSFWPRKSDCIFGSSMAAESFHCINCYNSENLNRCFEVDSSKSCSDSFYLHNCENVRSSLFCFNAKNLNYAVGNTAVGKEQFDRVKNMLLGWIGESLEKKESVPLSIFNLGCAKSN